MFFIRPHELWGFYAKLALHQTQKLHQKAYKFRTIPGAFWENKKLKFEMSLSFSSEFQVSADRHESFHAFMDFMRNDEPEPAMRASDETIKLKFYKLLLCALNLLLPFQPFDSTSISPQHLHRNSQCNYYCHFRSISRQGHDDIEGSSGSWKN